ncbi:helix-turn-helix transcriptional regulator [Bacillus cereus]
MMDIVNAFGTILKKHRKLNGLSQEQLAFLCDLDRTYIGLLERSQRQPSLKTIFRIANELNISASDLIREVEELIN